MSKGWESTPELLSVISACLENHHPHWIEHNFFTFYSDTFLGWEVSIKHTRDIVSVSDMNMKVILWLRLKKSPEFSFETEPVCSCSFVEHLGVAYTCSKINAFIPLHFKGVFALTEANKDFIIAWYSNMQDYQIFYILSSS